MATYYQSTGTFITCDGSSYCGYSGKGDGLNNPGQESVPFVGPIPKGVYTVNSKAKTNKGDPTLGLTPAASNNMYGRSGFLIHADNDSNNNSASEGCIVVPPEARRKINIGDTIVVEY